MIISIELPLLLFLYIIGLMLGVIYVFYFIIDNYDREDYSKKDLLDNLYNIFFGILLWPISIVYLSIVYLLNKYKIDCVIKCCKKAGKYICFK